jgi:hypothetical protein
MLNAMKASRGGTIEAPELLHAQQAVDYERKERREESPAERMRIE